MKFPFIGKGDHANGLLDLIFVPASPTERVNRIQGCEPFQNHLSKHISYKHTYI